jgi:hypothetical protein
MRTSTLGLSLLVLAGAAPFGCVSSSSSAPSAVALDGGPLLVGADGGSADGADDVDSAAGSECAPPTKGPTTHGGGSSADGDETWTADTSPHLLTVDTTIYGTVTLEPCAEVLIAEGKTVTVRGKLIAEGTATRRIHIGAKDAGKAFASIHAAGAPLRFAYTTIDGGGAPLNVPIDLAGMLDLQGDNLQPTQELLSVDHVTLQGSASNGVVLRDGAGFSADSNALVVGSSASHPVSVFARSVGGIPVGSYTGNADDTILLPTTSGNDTINETTTLHERGVPYLVGHATSGGDLRVDTTVGKPDVTLTIEPGVIMKFKKGGVLRIAVASSASPARASLVAVGTAAKKIVFTSAEAAPAAGDWLGLRFGELPTVADKVEFARVEYAGGTSTSGSGSCPDNSELMNDAALRITGAPPSQFVTNTEIVESLTNGIDRGWRSDQPVIDFLPTNTFANVALCQQTFPPTANNVCPSTVPCPM